MGTFNLFDRKNAKASCIYIQQRRGLCRRIEQGFCCHQNRGQAKTIRQKNVKHVIKAVSGFAPYEKRAMEMFKVSNTKMDKRARKFLKKRLGSIKRGKAKAQLLQELTRKK